MKSLRLVTALLLVTSAASAAAFEFNTLIVGGRPEGDPLGPQLGAGADWHGSLDNLNFWSNHSGQVAFYHQLQGAVTAEIDRAAFRWTNGVKELLLREGEQAAGFPAGVTSKNIFGTMDIADDGSILMDLEVGGTAGVNDDSLLYFSPNNTLSVVGWEGHAAPAPLPPFFTYAHDYPNRESRYPVLSRDGRILFRAELSGPGINADNDGRLFYGTPGSLQTVNVEGEPAPGRPAGTTLFDTGIGVAAGDFYAITSRTQNPNAPNPDFVFGLALYRGTAVGPRVLLASDDDFTGVPGGRFQRFSAPRINASGQITVSANVFANDTNLSPGLYKTVASGLEVLALQTLPAPDTGLTFGNSSASDNQVEHILTDSGAIAFAYNLAGAGVNDANDEAIWIHDENGSRLALREGDSVGDMVGVSIGELLSFAFNDSQNLAVVSMLTGNVTGDDDQALWVSRSNGMLDLILRKGDAFDVDPSAAVDLRTISEIRLATPFAPNPFSAPGAAMTSLTDNAQLAFSLAFTDGHTGVFTTNVSVIPEPSSVAMFLVGTISAGLVGRQRL